METSNLRNCFESVAHAGFLLLLQSFCHEATELRPEVHPICMQVPRGTKPSSAVGGEVSISLAILI